MAIRIRVGKISEINHSQIHGFERNLPRLWNLPNRAYTALTATTAGLR